jgi:hypothetical protein
MVYKIKNKKSQQYEDYILYGDKENDEEKNLFKVPKIELDEDASFKVEEDNEAKREAQETFRQEREDVIKEINDDLYSEEIPIEIKDTETLIVKASGTDHKITRKDLAEYQRTQLGTETPYRQIGNINGDAGMVDKIVQDIEWTFNRLDEKLKSYRTSQVNDD